MEEQQEEPEQENGLARLKFNEPLSWRPGQNIPAEQLLKRLDKLSKELGDMEQEQVDTDSLSKVAKELVAPKLLNHKDKGVRAFTASCVVEMLRLYAPNAPYTPSQLKARIPPPPHIPLTKLLAFFLRGCSIQVG